MPRKPSIILECVICGKEFKASPSRIKPNGNTCSLECMGKRNRKLNNVKCVICGKEFHVKPSRLKRMVKPDMICCSKKCSNESRKTRICGENNHQHGLKGELNSSWGSDIRMSRFGYVLIRVKNHPYRHRDDFIPLHRAIYEEYAKDIGNYDVLEFCEELGDYFLRNDLVVHHKDFVKTNNTIDNLEIMTLSEHSSFHNSIREHKRDMSTGRFISSDNNGKKSLLERKYKFDAGQDITSAEDLIICSKSSKIISTGLTVSIPENFVGLIWSKSGLSVKHEIEVGAGCIDCGYTGEVKVHLYNFSDVDFKISKGDKIAQLLLVPINIRKFVEVKSIDDSERGENGFGSTGK